VPRRPTKTVPQGRKEKEIGVLKTGGRERGSGPPLIASGEKPGSPSAPEKEGVGGKQRSNPETEKRGVTYCFFSLERGHCCCLLIGGEGTQRVARAPLWKEQWARSFPGRRNDTLALARQRGKKRDTLNNYIRPRKKKGKKKKKVRNSIT